MTKLKLYGRGVLLFWLSVVVVPTFAGDEIEDDAVRLRTVLGDIFVTFTPDAAPQTVANFIAYLESGDYEETFFHRSLPGGDGAGQFIVAGRYRFSSGPAGAIEAIPERAPVANEFNQSNRRGTIAMVVPEGEPDGATNAWLINVADNGGSSPTGLDFADGGATVFGTINAAGMEVVDEINAQCTDDRGGNFSLLPTLSELGPTGSREELIRVTETIPFERVSAPVSAILPGSRSIGFDGVASAFATILNTSDDIAASCRIQPITDVPAVFEYFQTDPSTNQVISSANPPLDIEPNGFATVFFTFRPINGFPSTEIEFDFSCGNSLSDTPAISGVNTFQLAAIGMPGADIVAVTLTADGNGITDIAAGVNSGAFVAAITNVGVSETLEVSADTGEVDLPVAVFVCETNPTTGACLAPPASVVTVTQAASSTATFAVFVQLLQSGAVIPFDPARNRTFLRFRSQAGELRGSTSVAIRTVP